MVNYLKEFEDGLEDFLDLTIYFNENEIRYKSQGFWTSSNFEKDIREKSKKLTHLLSRQLKNGRNNKMMLSEIQSKMREAYNFLYDVDYLDYDNLSKSNLKIKKSSALPVGSFKDDFTYQFFEKISSGNNNKNNSQNEKYKYSILFNSLSELFMRCQMNGDGKPNRLQFENVKLLACIYCYSEILFDWISKIDHALENFDMIDFSTVESISAEIESVKSIEENNKCHSSLNKLGTAQLFKFLFDEGYLFANKRPEKNETMFKRFLARNFTFNKNGIQSNIGLINQEFSELKWQHSDIQVQFINELIEKLESRKQVILDFRKPKPKKID